MCIVCVTTAKTHLHYMKVRGITSVPDIVIGVAAEKIHDGVMENMEVGMRAVSKAQENSVNGMITVSESDLVGYSACVESNAIRFASEGFTKEGLELQIDLAEEFEALRAALTLIQSKAMLGDFPEIQKIAEDALRKESKIKNTSVKMREYLKKLTETHN